MKIAVYGNQCQDHKVEEIRALFEALRASGAFIEVERGFLEYVKGLIPDVAADKAVGDGEVLAVTSWRTKAVELSPRGSRSVVETYRRLRACHKS